MRRGRSKSVREVTNFQQAPYGQKKNPFQPMSIFSEVEEELSGFVDRRVSEGGAAPL